MSLQNPSVNSLDNQLTTIRETVKEQFYNEAGEQDKMKQFAKFFESSFKRSSDTVNSLV